MSAVPQIRGHDRTAIQDRRPIVISGPSGVGKGTLIQRLLDTHPGVFTTTISHTTRAPRRGEVDGVNYYFVSPDVFKLLISQHAFVEYTLFSGHYYGTSKHTVAEQTAKGMVVLLDIDMQGVKQMKAHGAGFDARYVFIKPPSIEALEARLKGRGTENEQNLQQRLTQARTELEYAKTSGVHDIIIVNDTIEEAFQSLDDYIFSPTPGTSVA